MSHLGSPDRPALCPLSADPFSFIPLLEQALCVCRAPSRSLANTGQWSQANPAVCQEESRAFPQTRILWQVPLTLLFFSNFPL